ncbi:myb/SANT-like DNA-binding domain-containing protein 3 [Aphis craccivora]|uniref:Regulatory protein zeste n=1 Tax=Aphis craccivora TaxID=307492 RepID=A0A6G0VYH5_APHCR|nr:myb/SANT-like DNA-binding domain-containing protein 3 [Aphis craccivora]
MTDTKRPRGKNFLESEKEMLIDLIVPHKSIIENIKTDNATNKSKDSIWEQITIDYNTHQQSGIRSISQLKNVYDNLKRVTRKEKSDQKVSYILNTLINFSH